LLRRRKTWGGYGFGTIATAVYSPDGALIVTAAQ